MVFEIAVGTARTNEPEYKYVKFKSLTGKDIEIDDPVVLVMNTMDRQDSLLPEFPKVELPRVEFEAPDLDDIGREAADAVTKLAAKWLTRNKYQNLFQSSAEKAAMRIPEVDSEEIGKLMKDAISKITSELDIEDAITDLLEDLPDMDWAQQLRDVVKEIFEDRLMFDIDLGDYLPTAAQFKALLPDAEDIEEIFEKIINDHILGALQDVFYYDGWLRDIYQDIMTDNFSSWYKSGTTTPKDIERHRGGTPKISGTNLQKTAFIRLHATLNKLTEFMGKYVRDNVKDGGDMAQAITAFGNNIGKELIEVLDGQMEQIWQTLFEIVDGIDDKIKDQFHLQLGSTRKAGKEDNFAYMLYSLAGTAGQKVEDAIEDVIIPLISGLLSNKILPTFDDIAEQIGIQVGETFNDLLNTGVFQEQAKGLGKAIGKEVDGLMERDLLPHLNTAITTATVNMDAAFSSMWDDNVSPQFDEINGVIDYIQNAMDTTIESLTSFTIEKILMPILSPVEEVGKDGFYVYTKGDQKPVRYIAFSGSGLSGGATLDTISDYIRGLREKFDAPWAD